MFCFLDSASCSLHVFQFMAILLGQSNGLRVNLRNWTWYKPTLAIFTSNCHLPFIACQVSKAFLSSGSFRGALLQLPRSTWSGCVTAPNEVKCRVLQRGVREAVGRDTTHLNKQPRLKRSPSHLQTIDRFRSRALCLCSRERIEPRILLVQLLVFEHFLGEFRRATNGLAVAWWGFTLPLPIASRNALGIKTEFRRQLWNLRLRHKTARVLRDPIVVSQAKRRRDLRTAYPRLFGRLENSSCISICRRHQSGAFFFLRTGVIRHSTSCSEPIRADVDW